MNEEVMIPRIMLLPSDMACAVMISRRQFFVRAALCMTINKSQGRTLERAGIYLPAPCFGHGQLYVAMSRVGKPGGLKFMITHPVKPGELPGMVTEDVVFKGVFGN